MGEQASGPFEVNMSPLEAWQKDGPLGRMSIDKRFHGPLEATSQGEMLSVMNPALGSGGYVALERVSGTLGGRKGTFVLLHSATMTRGEGALSVTVVPDSGTGDLAGLTGTMRILIAPDGSHSYDFQYALPATR